MILLRVCLAAGEEQARELRSSVAFRTLIQFKPAVLSVVPDLHCCPSCRNLPSRTLLCKSRSRLSFSRALLFERRPEFAPSLSRSARAALNLRDSTSKAATLNPPSIIIYNLSPDSSRGVLGFWGFGVLGFRV